MKGPHFCCERKSKLGYFIISLQPLSFRGRARERTQKIGSNERGSERARESECSKGDVDTIACHGQNVTELACFKTFAWPTECTYYAARCLLVISQSGLGYNWRIHLHKFFTYNVHRAQKIEVGKIRWHYRYFKSFEISGGTIVGVRERLSIVTRAYKLTGPAETT